MTDSTPTAAIIGLDGLTTADVTRHAPWLDVHEFAIETVAHTCPSWNTILSGETDPAVVDFFKIPDGYTPGESVASQSDAQWSYDELDYTYLWDRVPGVEVVSAPVVLPAYSTVYESGHAPNALCWPTDKAEIDDAIRKLTFWTDRFERVVTVYPMPDKANHLRDNGSKDYTADDRAEQLGRLFTHVDALTDAFDRWAIVSDHGEPAPREWVTDDLWVASHDPVGVVASNCVDVSGVETGQDVYGVLEAVLEGGDG